MRIPPKIHIFPWRVGHDILPTNAKIATINKNFDRTCFHCGSAEESSIHALRDCPKARNMLMLEGLDARLIEKGWDRCIDWLEDALRYLDKVAFKGLTALLWNIWNSRSNLFFKGKEENVRLIWESAKTFCNPLYPIQNI